MNNPPALPALRRLMAGLLALPALLAAAQPAPPTPAPDPLDPQARVPAPSYRSPFPTAKGGAEDKPISWQAANETVGRIGGWRVYARESAPAQPPGTAPAPKPAAAAAAAARPAASAPAGHAGHKMP